MNNKKIMINTSDDVFLWLDIDETSYLKISYLPDDILKDINFDELFDLRPKEKGAVFVHDKSVPVDRRYTTFGVTPKLSSDWDSSNKFSYMYDDGSGKWLKRDIPDTFDTFMKFLNENKNTAYNQVIANWYKLGTDYIAFHRDCTIGMNKDADIAVVTLLEDGINGYPRDFVIKSLPKTEDAIYKEITIKTNHGSIITMGGDAQDKFAHGVPKISSTEPVSRRISLSFRSFETT